MFIDNYVSWTDSSNNFTNKLFQESFHIILHRYLINDYIIEVFFFWHGGTTSSIYLKNAGTNQSETYDDYWRYSKCREKKKINLNSPPPSMPPGGCGLLDPWLTPPPPSIWAPDPALGVPPCWAAFIIFLYLLRLFWNHILTWNRREREWGRVRIATLIGHFRVLDPRFNFLGRETSSQFPRQD